MNSISYEADIGVPNVFFEVMRYSSGKSRRNYVESTVIAINALNVRFFYDNYIQILMFHYIVWMITKEYIKRHTV